MDTTVHLPDGQASDATKPLLRFSLNPEVAAINASTSSDSGVTLTVLCPLNGPQQMAFKDCEAKIERGLKTFYEVGVSLMEIRDQRYYREHYDTFEGYCKERWGLARQTAYQHIAAAQVVDNVCNCGQTDRPRSESQARELGRLPADQQAGCWQDIVAGCGGVEKVTAAKVKQTVELWLADNEPYRRGADDADDRDQNQQGHGGDEQDQHTHDYDEATCQTLANLVGMTVALIRDTEHIKAADPPLSARALAGEVTQDQAKATIDGQHVVDEQHGDDLLAAEVGAGQHEDGHADEQLTNDLPERFSIALALAKLENAIMAQLAKWPREDLHEAADRLECLAKMIRRDGQATEEPA